MIFATARPLSSRGLCGLALLAILTCLSLAHGQTTLFRVESQTPGDGLGLSVEALGDTNGDGVPDVVVGRSGSLTLHSGKDGTILATVTGEDGLGEEIAVVGDLDGDGLSEILAGAPEGEYALTVSLALTPFSGLTLELQQDGMLQLSREHAITDEWILESSNDLQVWTVLETATFGDPIILNREQLGLEAFFRWRAPQP